MMSSVAQISTSALTLIVRRRLRVILWISTLFLVVSYVGGHIHSSYGQALERSRLMIEQTELLVRHEQDQMISEVMLAEQAALEKRLVILNSNLRKKLNDEDLCVEFVLHEGKTLSPPCAHKAALVKLSDLSLLSGSHSLATISIFITKRDEIDEAVRRSAPTLILVLLVALASTSLVFWLAERNVIKPFVDEIRRRERDSAVAQIVHMLAHDIRKPFCMMEIILKDIRSADTLEATQKILAKHAASIEYSAQEVSAQLNDILVYGHDSVIRRKPLSVVDLFKQSFEDLVFSKRVPDFNLTLEGEPVVLAAVDEAKIRRVFDNLISNAIDASGPHGSLLLNCKSIPGETVLTIANSGSSIPEDRLQNIFEPFYTSGKSRGTGLGLAIVKKFVEAHGGTIICKNISGWGVSFEIRLPKSPPAAKEQGQTAQSALAWPLSFPGSLGDFSSRASSKVSSRH